MEIENGIIIKALSGFYYVSSEDGSIIECKARGKVRAGKELPLAGDRVRISRSSDTKGNIEEILPRKNSFIRPAVANIDTMVFVAANTNPVTDMFLLDKVSVIAEKSGCEFLICINKTDIDSADTLYKTYSRSGFKVVRFSAATGTGKEELLKVLFGKICVLTGNSGVGKSSILNNLMPGIDIAVNDVSEKLGRGKHTTRNVEFYPLNDTTFVADTPGFASYEVEMIQDIDKSELQDCFPDFREHIDGCRFSDCRHLKEPGCALRQAVADGLICESRYLSYTRLYEKLSLIKPWETQNQ